MFLRKLLIAAVVGATIAVPVATPASAVQAFEWDTATTWDGYGADVATIDDAGDIGRFAFSGDMWSVYDYAIDGHSAAVYWYNYDSNGALYRQGACINSKGAKMEAQCNKNYVEGSKLKFQVCSMEAASHRIYGNCSPWITTHA